MVAVVREVGAGSRPTSASWSAVRIDAAPLHRRVRLPASTYRRRRAVAAGLVGVLVLGLSAALGMLGGGPLPASERPNRASRGLHSGESYVVQPGDTFWSIAVRLDPERDPRPLVDRLVATHGGTTLHVGERLPLPLPDG